MSGGGGGGRAAVEGNAGTGGRSAGSGVRAGLDSFVVGRLRTPSTELPTLGRGRGLPYSSGEVKVELMGNGMGPAGLSSGCRCWRTSIDDAGLGVRLE